MTQVTDSTTALPSTGFLIGTDGSDNSSQPKKYSVAEVAPAITGTLLIASLAEFNAAIAAAVASDGWLILRPGTTISIDAPLAAVTSGNLRIRGNGSTIVYTGADVVDAGVGATNSTHGVIKFENAAGECVIEGLTIVRSTAPTAVGKLHGISISKGTRAEIKGCVVNHMHAVGIAIRRTPVVSISESKFSRNAYAGHTTCGGAVTVDRNEYIYNGLPDTGAGYNMAFASAQFGDEVACAPSSVTNNVMRGVVRKGIDIHHGQSVLISGNVISGQVTETLTQPSMIYAIAEGADKDVRDIMVTVNEIDIDDSLSVGSIGIYVGGPNATTGLSALGEFIVTSNRVKGVRGHGIYAGGSSDALSGQVDNITIKDNEVSMGDSSAAIGISAGRGSGSSTNVRMLNVINNDVTVGAIAHSCYSLHGGAAVVRMIGNTSTSRGAGPWGVKTLVDTRLVMRDNDIYGEYQADLDAATLNKSGNYFSGVAD